MAYKFNPFTGNFDDFNGPNGEFTSIDVEGDITLDDGGTYTTTLQTITPTAARTISFPDATGTVALVGGSSGQFIFNSTGALAGSTVLSIDGSNNITQNAGRYLLGVTSANTNGGALQLSGGITFPATQAAASDPNTLDDYEEGTWTPSVGGDATYNSRSGTYTKIGRFVHVAVYISINTLGTGSSTSITSLPFAASGDGLAASNHVGFWGGTSRSVTSLMACTNTNEIVFTDTTTAATATNLNAGIMGNGTDLRFTLVYRV